MEDLKSYLISKVLLLESDTLPSETDKALQLIRRDKTDNPLIYISSGTSGIIAGSDKTLSTAKAYIEDNGITAKIIRVGCAGPFNYEPFVCIQMPGKNKLYFRNVTEDKIESLLNGVFHNDINEDDLVGQSGERGFGMWPGIPYLNELPFFSAQKRIVLGNCGLYDPESIEEYIARGGYRSYVKTIRHYTYEEVCGIIEKSGLRGRSGGGYPTGVKWKQALNASSNLRYLICNARESDPGSFCNITMLESDPHRLIEGMAIASYAIGSSTAIIYLKAGSDCARVRLQKAIDSARDYGLLGHNIYSSGYNLDITIRVEPGAFVCGEETALVNSLREKGECRR